VIAALLLIAYASTVAGLGARLLRREWSSRAPRAAIVGWQALSTSVVLAILLAAVALALPFLPMRYSLSYLLNAHTITVVEHYETPLGIWPGVAGLGMVAVLAGLLAVTTARAFRRTAQVRRSQRAALRLVGNRHPEGFTIVDHAVPVAYCLPGGSGTVVLSTAALEILTDRERELVLGHEHRHLRARHHLAVAYADALRRTFRWVPLFAEAHDQVTVLLEMAADDAASGVADRRSLAHALVALGTGVRPEAAMAASDTAALQRVRRLTAPPEPRRRGMGLMVGAAAVAALSVPVGLALAPAIEAATRDCCSLAAPPARG
jgi:Zn-dependent protease with chaperone function